jgi:hypothetical protein
MLVGVGRLDLLEPSKQTKTNKQKTQNKKQKEKKGKQFKQNIKNANQKRLDLLGIREPHKKN